MLMDRERIFVEMTKKAFKEKYEMEKEAIRREAIMEYRENGLETIVGMNEDDWAEFRVWQYEREN